MIFVIGIIKKGLDTCGEILKYNILDTSTDSHMYVTPVIMQNILSNCSTPVANAKLHSNNIILKDWVDNITVKLSGSTNQYPVDDFYPNTRLVANKCAYTLISKKGNQYKLASFNGALKMTTLHELRGYIGLNKIANCRVAEDNSNIDSTDTYEIIANKAFEKSIADKYEVFLAKTVMLGYGDISFDYKIENAEIILQRYTGSSKNIILPSFITAIMTKAFEDAQIEKLSLNEGLVSIGDLAFLPKLKHDGIESVEIPSTVEIIAPFAFMSNTKICNHLGILNPNRFKLTNNKTIVMAKL